jgi:hypothetical protein
MAFISPIDWNAFTWEAFSTLATGLAAVLAAIVIGLRQAGIAHRQAEIADQQRKILGQQADTDSARLKGELFEKRFAVYEGVKSFLSAIVREGGDPGGIYAQGFLVALDQSRFLYRAQVSDDLQEIWEECCKGFANKSEMKASYDRMGDYGKERIDKEYKFALWAYDRLTKLSDLFGDELKLSAP